MILPYHATNVPDKSYAKQAFLLFFLVTISCLARWTVEAHMAGETTMKLPCPATKVFDKLTWSRLLVSHPYCHNNMPG